MRFGLRSALTLPYRGAIGSAAAPEFVPTDVPGLIVWFDPSNLSTLWQDTGGTVPVTADGQSVALMDDKGGNGNHHTQATASKRLVYKTDGTHHWLLADGVDDIPTYGSQPFGASISDGLVCAAYQEVTRKTSFLFTLGESHSATGRWSAHAPWSDGVCYFDTGEQTGANRVSAAIGVAAGNDLVATFKGSVTDSEQFVRINGTQIAGDATGHTVSLTGAATLLHGLTGPGATVFMNARLHQFAAYEAAVTLENIQKLESFMAGKNGATV